VTAVTPRPRRTLQLVPYDNSLFLLRIVLVELWFGQDIEDFRGPRSATFDDSTAYETAQDYIGKVFTSAGETYGLAGSRCLGTLQTPQKSLEETAFKNKAHFEIVYLLEKNFKVLQPHVAHTQRLLTIWLGIFIHKLLSKPGALDLSCSE